MTGPQSAALADAAAHELDRQAWQAQYRDFDQAQALGRTLAQGAADEAWRGRGWFHVAFAQIRAAGSELDLTAYDTVCRGAAQRQDRLLQALCRDLQALLLRREKRHTEALALMEVNLQMPESERGLNASYVSTNLASQCALALADLDRSLALRYQALGIAEALGDPALLANACANLAGVQNDVLNLDDGLNLAQRAVQSADAAQMQGSNVWLTATFNLCVAQLLSGDGPSAWATARRMQGHQEQVPLAKRARYDVLWASAALKADQLPEAERGLGLARSRWDQPGDALIEWHVTRAALDNRLGRHAQAQATCEAARALTLSGGDEVLPIDWMQLCDEAVRACEALHDHAAALAWKHQAFAQYELLAGRATRARRVTAEVQHALDLARRARDEAQRRHQDAEAEQRRLAELNEALRQAGEARTRFLAAASHDLRQPLHALALQCANLSQRLQASPDHDAVDRMQQAVTSLTGMFDSLLDLSHIEAGAVRPRWTVVSLPTLLARLLEEYAAEAEHRGLRLALRMPAAARSLQLHSDARLLERLLRNLISNALKYTRVGGVLVALRQRHAPKGSLRWRLQVIDTGVGIAAEEQLRVFEAFYQVATPNQAASEGLGLGLSIVQRLSTLLGHPLHLRSNVGCGSCVGIEFDALLADAGSARQAVASAPTLLPPSFPLPEIPR